MRHQCKNDNTGSHLYCNCSVNIFAVGSTNPVKLQAVRDGAGLLLTEIEVIAASVDSGVSAQPIGNEEMIAGATQRAQAALVAHPVAHYGVGLEGGVVELHEGMFATAWCVVVQRDGRQGMASTGNFLLPPQVADLVRAGVELGHACDQIFGTRNSKHNLGTTGILTHGKYTRAEYYAPAVTLALIPFVNSELFPS